MFDRKKIEKAITQLLEGVGEDVNRPGLKGTPARVSRMYEEILGGMEADPARELGVVVAHDHDEIILVKDIPLHSICEHHLLPFIGKAHVAYIPRGGRVTGLSKLARVVDIFSKRLQVQERLTTLVADTIMGKLKPRGVMVIIEADHLCMTMRGIKKPGAVTVTSAVRGIFKENEKTRAEALALIRRS